MPASVAPTRGADPMPGSASVSMVNAGLEGFVRAAALADAAKASPQCFEPAVGERKDD